MQGDPATYSFLDVQANLTGTGGNIELGNGAGTAKEGITVEYTDDKGVILTGADGRAMQTLRGSKSGTITVRLLQTSPTNGKLMTMYNQQSSSSLFWGKNTITIRNTATGDVTVATGCAFKKVPNLTYAEDGSTYEWAFLCAYIDIILGSGE